MRLVAGWAREPGSSPGSTRYGNLWALPGGAGRPARHLRLARRHRPRRRPLRRRAGHRARPRAGRRPATSGRDRGPRGAAGVRRRGGAAVRRRHGRARGCWSGTLRRDALADLHDDDGVSAADARAAYLERARRAAARSRRRCERLRAHAEVHVAQRRALRELGVVTDRRLAAAASRSRIARRGRPRRRGLDGRPPRRAGGRPPRSCSRSRRPPAPSRAETVATVGTLAVDARARSA